MWADGHVGSSRTAWKIKVTVKTSRPDKSETSGPVEQRSIGEIFYLVAIALFACAIVFGFCYPGSALEVAAGQALTSNMLWLVACAASSVAAMFGGTVSVPQWSWRWRVCASCLVAIVALICLSTILVGPSSNYRNAINAMWQWVASGAIVVTVVALYRCHPPSLKKFSSALLLLALFVAWNLALYGCYQKFVEYPADIARYEASPAEVLKEAGIPEADEARRLLFIGRLYDAAPTATYSLTNNLAITLAVALVILAGGFLRLWSRNKLKAVAMLVVLGLPIGVCLLLTKSRTAWLGAIAALAWLAFVNLPSVVPNQKHRRLLVSAAVALAIVAIGGIYLWDSSILRDASMSLAYRMTYWFTTTEIISHHPWLGVASGNFQDYYSQFKAIDAAETVSDPHSMWFETAASGGIVAGVLLVVASVLLVINCVLQDWRQKELVSSVGPAPEATEQQNDMPLKIALGTGAIAGWFLPWFVFNWLGSLPGFSLYDIGLPATAVLLLLAFLFYSNSVEFASGTLVAIALTFLISMSFSGGWMTPGVSNLWFAVAGLMVCSGYSVHENLNAPASSRTYSMTALAGMAAVLVLFYTSAWHPVRATAAKLSELQSPSTRPSPQLFQELIDSDPINPELWQIVAEVYWNRCCSQLAQQSSEVSVDSKLFDDYHRLSEGFIARNANSWSAYMRRANWQFEFASLNNVAWMSGVTADFDRAAELYPSDVEVLIQAALAHFIDGDYAAADRLLSRAELIDKTNVHLEQRIQVGRVYWPVAFGTQILKHKDADKVSNRWANTLQLWESGRVPIDKTSGNLKAEPLANAMRTILDAQPPTQSSLDQSDKNIDRK